MNYIGKKLLFLSLFSVTIAYGQRGKRDTVSRGIIRVCKCFVTTGANEQPFFGNEVDTVKQGRVVPVCLQLSTSCPEGNKIISFEMVIPSNGLSKTFTSNSGCMTGEMESAFANQGGNGGYIIIQNVKMGLPDGKIARIPGKTFFIPKRPTK